MNETENGVSWLHRFGSLVAVMTFLLFMTGMLTSGTGALFLTPHWSGLSGSAATSHDSPGKYAYAYRVLALMVSGLTIIFAVWLRKSDSRRYLKNLGNITVGVLLAIALVVLSPARSVFPAAASFCYMCGIQIFFCLTVCLALFTRTDWHWDEPKTSDLASPSVRQILVFTTAAVFVQPLLGKGFQTGKMGIAPHLVLGIIVTLCTLWVMEMALTKFSHLRTFKISTIFLAELVGLQLFLGIISYSMNLNARAVSGPYPGLVVMNITHAAVGALVLATSLFVTCQGFKYFAPAQRRTPSAALHENQEAELQED